MAKKKETNIQLVDSRSMIMDKLVQDGYFAFAGFIQNESRATTLVLFKAVARWYGIPFSEANAITGKYADKLAEKEYDGWLKEAVDLLGFDWQDHWDRVEKKMQLCYRLDKIPYSKSSAASGVIMTDKLIDMPIREAEVKYNGPDLEENGYIKFDILTVTTLNMIQDFFGLNYDWNNPEDVIVTKWGDIRMVDKVQCDADMVITGETLKQMLQDGEYVKVQTVNGDPFGKNVTLSSKNVKMVQKRCNDPKVWDSIDRGETDFVFQFASPGMKRIITKTRPRNITAMAEINALYRPGPIEAGYIEKYIALKAGEDANLTDEEKVIYNVLKGVFGPDHVGLLIFQEDIMRLCTECAGFTLTEADDIRRAMGKKKESVLREWEEPFIKNWNIPNLITIDGLGDFLPDYQFQLSAGGTITANELYLAVQNGESVDIEV